MVSKPEGTKAPLARLLNQLEQSIRGSMKQKNYGAAVSGIRLMNEMIISPHKR